ncbi:MAG: DUF4280 domain-containing protein [Lachnospiraceae bacterium]|nr:DUF4280 domain-containing protein [Lachnospiraceae bacterium]
MNALVVSGAVYRCSGGAGPGTLKATSQQKLVLEAKPALTIKDGAAFVNIVPCSSCVCPTHPAIAPVLSATGVIVPQPCTPQTCGVWTELQSRVLVEGIPCLTGEAKITCTFGGVISIADPGQKKTVL